MERHVLRISSVAEGAMLMFKKFLKYTEVVIHVKGIKTTRDLHGRVERYQAMIVSNNDGTRFFIGDLSLAWRC